MTPFTVALRRDAPTPIYQQLFEQIRERIQSGEIKPGTRLPASRQWAEQLGISRISVVSALELLENAGLVISRDRRGLFVVEQLPVSRAAWALNDGDFAGNHISPAQDQEFPALISFSTGSLPTEFMPVEAMRAALNRVLDRDAGAALGYEPTEGYPPLRRAIAESVHAFGINVTGDQVLVTGGCQQAIDLAVQSLVPQGGAILTTDPTYIGLLDIARTRGLEVISVPFTADGLDFTALEQAIETRTPRLLYLMTSFHNPTGAILSLPQRRRLLALAGQYQLPILEDGVYDGLSYSEADVIPLKALDSDGLVLYASGFSKTVVPGTRIGYLISSERYYQRIARVKQAADVCTPGLNQRAMTEILQGSALRAHLEAVRRACKRRRDALVNALERARGVWRWSVPEGGLYLWLELPSTGMTAAELLRKSSVLGVDFVPGTDFSPDAPEHWAYFLRLNFTSHPPPVLEEGIRRLWAAWNGITAL